MKLLELLEYKEWIYFSLYELLIIAKAVFHLVMTNAFYARPVKLGNV